MANESSAFEIKPMDQFIITPLFSEGDLQWYTFTNQSLWMLIALIGIILLFVFIAVVSSIFFIGNDLINLGSFLLRL